MSPTGAFGSASPSPARCPHHKGGFLVYSVSGEAAGGRRLGKGRVYKRLLLILKPFQEAGEGRGRGGPFQNIQRGGELANGSVVMWKNEGPPPRPLPLGPSLDTAPTVPPRAGTARERQIGAIKKKKEEENS